MNSVVVPLTGIACALIAQHLFAVGDNAESRQADTPDQALTSAQIVARPRPKTAKVGVPADTGVYIGSGVYSNKGKMKNSGFCFTYWEPEKLNYDEIIDLCVKEGVGNTLQFWQSNDCLHDLAKKAKARGLYSTCIYSVATNGIAAKLTKDLGNTWLGYDFGERYNFSLYQNWEGRGVSLQALVDEYMNRVHKHVGDLHAAGWGNVMATSANFSLDYEVAAGVEVPCTEDFPFGDLTLASALSRGLYRQYDLPMWGSHLAHEWYSWIPHKNPYKMKTLETAFLLKYMTGAKVIINESGNWQLQSSLCEDSPMARMPIPVRKHSANLNDPENAKLVKDAYPEAKKKFSYIDYRSPVAVKYRKAISDFTAFCKKHPAPKGQPEATWAIAKGNLDLGGAGYVPGNAICGAYDLAKTNPNWMCGVPEMSWDVVRKAVMPMPPMLAPNKNIHFSASPYGLCDVVSFACDNVTAEHLLKNYKVLMFAGWNTCTPKQYRILCDYVKGGGKLVIGLAHLSTDDKRDYTNLSVEKLVNKGDFTELCGFKVVGETSRKYWATGPSTEKNCLGFVARRRFGYMCLPLGKLEFSAPKENFEELAVDDEDAEPFLLRCKNGKGEVFFMNWWAYPAAANMDVGCGAEIKDVGMVGYLYQYAAKLGRGNVYITGPDFENPDGDCGWILYSYFPDEGKVYLLNLDYENERKCVLRQFGDKEFITLKGGEFRIVDSVKLDADEKLNNDAPVAEFFNDVKIPMRDGVKLAGDLYLPANRTGKIGCFLSFSPYNATKSDKPYVPDRGEEWGVATLAVDCRGCCHSEGVFEPWEKRLVDDADDLLKWIAAQPWSNGRVVTVGGSYPGNTQLACLKSANPALVACAPSVITFNPHSINYAPGNILIPEFFQKWHTTMSSAKSWKELTRHSDANDPYWLERCDLGRLADAKGRVLYQAGWFDMLGIETFESFALMPKGSFLRIGPWSHGVNTFDDPEINYNKVAEASVTEEMEIEFLRSALEGRDSETAKLPGKMQIFVMGANVWRYENEWPLARTVYRKLYFDEGLGLSFDAPKGAAGEDSFNYDPENPVPTNGGRIILDGGQFSQAEIEARKDVLSYTTETLDADLEITGNVMASLVAKSTANVADVAVKLVDVYPDGTPYNVLDSICRGTFAADAATKLDFRVDITSYVFKKGHKLRVEIAGSNSPHYEKAKEAATTRLVRGESHLVLPTIPDAEKVTERIELLTDGDIAKHWYTWLKGEYWDLNPSSGRIQLQSEGFGIEYRNIVLEPVE